MQKMFKKKFFKTILLALPILIALQDVSYALSPTSRFRPIVDSQEQSNQPYVAPPQAETVFPNTSDTNKPHLSSAASLIKNISKENEAVPVSPISTLKESDVGKWLKDGEGSPLVINATDGAEFSFVYQVEKANNGGSWILLSVYLGKEQIGYGHTRIIDGIAEMDMSKPYTHHADARIDAMTLEIMGILRKYFNVSMAAIEVNEEKRSLYRGIGTAIIYLTALIVQQRGAKLLRGKGARSKGFWKQFNYQEGKGWSIDLTGNKIEDFIKRLKIIRNRDGTNLSSADLPIKNISKENEAVPVSPAAPAHMETTKLAVELEDIKKSLREKLFAMEAVGEALVKILDEIIKGELSPGGFIEEGRIPQIKKLHSKLTRANNPEDQKAIIAGVNFTMGAVRRIISEMQNKVKDDEMKDILGMQRRYDEIRNELVKENQGLVGMVVKDCLRRLGEEWENSGVSSDDLFQIGNIYLISAIEGFDPHQGFEFSTYAVPAISRGIQRMLRQGLLEIPDYLWKEKFEIDKFIAKFIQTEKREPTVEEVAAGLNLPVSRVENIFRAFKKPVSLENLFNKEDEEYSLLGLKFPSNREIEIPPGDALIIGGKLEQALRSLDKREREIIKLRYESDSTLEEVGKILNISRERVRQIESKALKKLQGFGLQPEGPNPLSRKDANRQIKPVASLAGNAPIKTSGSVPLVGKDTAFRNRTIISKDISSGAKDNRDLKPFFKKHELGFQNIATVIMAVSDLKDIIIVKKAREGAIYAKIGKLNQLFRNGEIEIGKKIKTGVFKCSGKEYKYAVFHFKKEDKAINILFIEDRAALTSTELKELGIKNTEKYHLDCPGLEGVWFINPGAAGAKSTAEFEKLPSRDVFVAREALFNSLEITLHSLEGDHGNMTRSGLAFREFLSNKILSIDTADARATQILYKTMRDVIDSLWREIENNISKENRDSRAINIYIGRRIGPLYNEISQRVLAEIASSDTERPDSWRRIESYIKGKIADANRDGVNIVGVVVYGSWPRGVAHRSSDVDCISILPERPAIENSLDSFKRSLNDGAPHKFHVVFGDFIDKSIYSNFMATIAGYSTRPAWRVIAANDSAKSQIEAKLIASWHNLLAEDAQKPTASTVLEKEIDRTHNENFKYMPNIPEKTILCHIIVDSILPEGQRVMLKTLEQNMRDKSYSEKVASLTINKQDKFIDQLQTIMARQRELYKDYIVNFDVACPNTDLVAAILGTNLGIKALAFEPCKEADLAQVEDIILALRALNSGKIEILREAFKILAGKELPWELSGISDIDELIKRITFILPAAKVVDYSHIRRLNEIIRKNIEAAA
ncbi:MAG: hypothetical protein A3K16_06120 [Omnitrophica bacterium RIFCSPLOWO2_01_FULL_45_24]|nr:MAG: hypothetical protein A3G36_01980 [Omnitrophica bacterium RIFCSPLOWO2_12_FULL_45_13]OGW94873.1 MAG: hypothetical protein A3K16_06120 [Omnitrophica bacterium RIFCSPLOWO2_01_FULL_45_24]